MSTYQRIEDYENTQVTINQVLKSKVKLDEEKMPSGHNSPDKDYYALASTERQVAANESARLYGISTGRGGPGGITGSTERKPSNDSGNAG